MHRGLGPAGAGRSGRRCRHRFFFPSHFSVKCTGGGKGGPDRRAHSHAASLAQESFVLHMDEGGSIVSVEYGQPGGGCRTRSEGPVQLPARVVRRRRHRRCAALPCPDP